MESSFELFDHTADMGIRVRAAQPAGLIAPAVAGLYAAIGELTPALSIASPLDKGGLKGVGQFDSIQASAESGTIRPFRFEASAADPAILLRDLLTELLILFERDHRILAQIETAELAQGQLRVFGQSAPVDPDRSVYYREVKAITYHDLGIHEIEGGFEATLIVDI